MKKLGSAFLACVLLASISLSALASGEVTKYDYFASRDAYEALYRDAYKPLYEEYHENYRRLYSEAEKGSELAAFLAELKAEYREFFGYREEAGGTEGMSRYDVPAARGLMYASRYAEDWASAVYYCDEVLVPLIQERIEFLGDMIDRMHSFDGRGTEEPDGPDNPPEEPDEPLVDILERMNACIRDVVNSWGTFRSVDSEAPDQDKTGQINRLLEDAFGEEFRAGTAGRSTMWAAPTSSTWLRRTWRATAPGIGSTRSNSALPAAAISRAKPRSAPRARRTSLGRRSPTTSSSIRRR